LNIYAKGQQTKVHFAPGITWGMSGKKFSFFGGFEIPINLHGKYTFTLITKAPFDDPTYQTITLPKGLSFGVGALMGFNYFPAKWISIGSEFSPSLLKAKLSGKTETTDSSAGTYVWETQDEDKGLFYFEQRFSVNLAFWF
jgi:hypothetical protein